MQMLSYRSTCFIGSYDRRCFQPLAYFLVCTICLAAILFEYVLHCSLTYILAGQVGYKFCNPFERNTLHYIEVCHQCTEVATILDTTVGSFAVVYATAFTDLLVILFLTGLYDHLDINNLCITFASAVFGITLYFRSNLGQFGTEMKNDMRTIIREEIDNHVNDHHLSSGQELS